MSHQVSDLQMIPLASIDVLNTRERSARVFDEIAENIGAVGLRKPITVTPRPGGNGTQRFWLVCGEGRLKAYRKLGQATIPAMVVEVSEEDAFIMSLAENIARRQCKPVDLLRGIGRLHERGNDKRAIAKATGLSEDYIHGILHLLQHGEERLLVAVEGGRMPLKVALAIANATDDAEQQAALQEGYESGKLRGKELMHARQVVDKRRAYGRGLSRSVATKGSALSTSSLVHSYQREVARQRLVVKKAEFAQQRLLFVVEAMRQLFGDENFANLLRAEGLDTLPKQLAERIWAGSPLQ